MIRCYRDEGGAPRVDTQNLHFLVGTFLEQDVQGSVEWCDELIAIVKEMQTGVRVEWSGTGNAHSLDLTREKATIENLWAENLGQAFLPLETFMECLEDWRKCIASNGNKKTRLP